MQLFLTILVQYAMHLIDRTIFGIVIHGKTYHSQSFSPSRQVAVMVMDTVGYMMLLFCIMATYDAIVVEGMAFLVFIVVWSSFMLWERKHKNMITETVEKWDAKGALDWIWGGVNKG